ncbi:MAG TPA: hypothetical protein VFB79_17220 [Candidatus Angelobacter sp.]|nr:hypothetical protein [Candidatus Angelobacter sp.]
MSTAVLEKVSEPTPRRTVSPAPPNMAIKQAKQTALEIHSLFPVMVAGVIAFTLAVLFIGSILGWLALRSSGVMAP